MPHQRLEDAKPSADDVFYLDSSAIFPLYYARVAKEGKNAPGGEISRANRLTPFLKRALTANAKLRTTVLAVEEFAAKIRRERREREFRDAHVADWQEWRNADAAAADAGFKRVHQGMLLAMQWACDQLGVHQVKFECVIVDEGEELEAAIEQRKLHRALLAKHDRIDPMDALHIVVGNDIGVTAFVSFDNAWQSVSTINVIY